MDNRELLIDYQGGINYTTISNLLTELKEIINKQNEPIQIFKRLLSITDESLENISMYMEKNREESALLNKYPSVYQLSKKSESYRITVKNPVKINDKADLTKKIDRINTLSENELKSLYKKTIAEGKLSEQGGASLGLLIIAKSSCNKINYTFDQINQDISYFSLIIEITN
jgi:hypothetical protein